MAKVTLTKRYFAQVGAESIETDPEHVTLQREGAAFTTSSPVLFYRVTATRTVTTPAGEAESTYSGIGQTWDEAEANLEAQLPKEPA